MITLTPPPADGRPWHERLSTAVRHPVAWLRVLTGDGPDITDVRGQLDRLAEAHRELEALDGDAGLSTATRPGTTLPAPPPPAPSRDRR